MRYRDWMAAAEAEYERLLVLLADLSDEDWRRPTDCAQWDVHDIVAHLVGAAEATASPRELLRQARLGRAARPGADLVDGMNAVQVSERAGASAAGLVQSLRDAAERGVRARRRIPAPLRAVPLPFGPPLGVRPLGYLTGCIYTRDTWLHRIDVCRATGRTPVLTADHDGRIIADVVTEWARSHGQPFTLTLTGPAGGRWLRDGGPPITIDAVEFCRSVSGRRRTEGLLAHPVPF